MILRTASLALAMAMTALPALAQEAGKPQGGGDPFDIFSPAALGGASNAGSGGVLDAGARPGQGKRTTQTPPSSPAEADILAGTTSTTTSDAAEMEWAFAQERVETPPAAVKGEIDQRIQREIAAPADRYGNELSQLTRRAQSDPEGATREATRLAAESDREFPDLASVPDVVDGARGEVDEVSNAIETGELGPDGRSVTGNRAGGSPWDNFPASYSGYGYNDPSGVYSSNGFQPIRSPEAGTPDSRMSWWQKLVVKALEGVADGLKGLSERRANELKARNERIRRDYPAYRSYVDVEARRSIERSAFARAGAGYDRRLDDLILGPARGTSGSSGSTTAVRASDLPTPAASTDLRSSVSRPVARLPRVRDAVTGEERIVIDMPLGVDAVRPLR